MKGKLSPQLRAILRDKAASELLHRCMRRGGSLTLKIGDTVYRVSGTKNK